MKKSMIAALIGLAAGMGFTNAAQADERAWGWSPIGFGIAAPIQLPYMDSDIQGFRFGGFVGFNADVCGLDLGVSEMTTGDFRGLQCAGFTWTEGNVFGVQFGAVANVVGMKTLALQASCVNVVWDDACGVQIGGIVNYDPAFYGVQFGGLNWNTASSYGVQFGVANADQDEFVGWAAGLVNYAGSFRGFQLGAFNAAYEVTGYQVGIANACNKLRGVQFGLLNVITEGPLPIMVIANASF